jgi:hypothetical protein
VPSFDGQGPHRFHWGAFRYGNNNHRNFG